MDKDIEKVLHKALEYFENSEEIETLPSVYYDIRQIIKKYK